MVKRNAFSAGATNPQTPLWKVTGLEHTSDAFANQIQMEPILTPMPGGPIKQCTLPCIFTIYSYDFGEEMRRICLWMAAGSFKRMNFILHKGRGGGGFELSL